MTTEKKASTIPGIAAIAVLLGVLVVLAVYFANLISGLEGGAKGAAILTFVILAILDVGCFAGLFMLQPNQAAVLTLFGKYKGSVREAGLQWANPFLIKKIISLRVRNFETNHLKVNDKDGNPVEIAAVVVWKVVDSAEAMFEVDNYENYVNVQSESALRNLATAYPYDSHDEELKSLRGHTAAVADHLREELHDRLAKAGVEIVEARI